VLIITPHGPSLGLKELVQLINRASAIRARLTGSTPGKSIESGNQPHQPRAINMIDSPDDRNVQHQIFTIQGLVLAIQCFVQTFKVYFNNSMFTSMYSRNKHPTILGLL
jgi:hypothetical protein